MKFLPGCNISNIIVFTPWLVLNFAGLFAAFAYWITGKTLSFATSSAIILTAIIFTFFTISPYNDLDIL